MLPSPDKRAVPSPALVAWCDALPNVLWSVLSFTPVGIFCYQFVARPWLYGFGAVSLLLYSLPTAWYEHLRLSAGLAAYRKLGVPVVSRFVQHGALINGLLRRRYPGYRPLLARTAWASLVRTTHQQERFHWAMLVFFLLASGYAVALGQVGWALLLTLLNVGYNLYPVWLQQYIRLRLRPLRPNASS